MLLSNIALFTASALLGAQDADAFLIWWWPHNKPTSKYAFAGCTNDLNTWIGFFSFFTSSAEKCVAQCNGRGQMAYWKSGGACRCGASPSSTILFDRPFKPGMPGQCPWGTYESYVMNTDFEFAGCSSTMSTENAASTSPRSRTLPDAFSHCNSQNQILVWKKQGRDFIWQDYCYSLADPPLVIDDDPVPCTSDTYFVYGPAGTMETAQQKQRVRRSPAQARLDLAQMMMEDPQCPAGLTACKVSADDIDGYECVDTDSEVSNCGGCANGIFGRNVAQVKGTDCATLAQSDSAASVCAAGECRSG